MYARVILGRCVVQVGPVQWDDRSFVGSQCKVRACTLTTVDEICLGAGGQERGVYALCLEG